MFDSAQKDKKDAYESYENDVFGFSVRFTLIQDSVCALLEVLRPCKIVKNETVASLIQIFQKELNFKPSEISRLDI
jgi:hypothetical protein